jgi:pimeloyl-ACP methyl ester carboxylesterase
MAEPRAVRTPTLEIAYEESGPPGGTPVVLLHGFPDDVRAWDGAVGPLASAGLRVLVPYLRGYGPTRFLDAGAPRMAQQAAIGQDLIDFLEALALPPVALAGYDWGGRAACITAILRPERVRGLVTVGGYNVQNTLAPPRPASALQERAHWYQWYFNTARGVAGLTANRREICRLLWRDWSPGYRFDDVTFEATAASWDTPDFVPIVIHSYRHRHGHAPGEPRYDAIEQHLATRPPITVPSVVLHGAEDGVDLHRPGGRDLDRFPAGTRQDVVPGAGHFLPRERPDAVVGALRSLLG